MQSSHFVRHEPCPRCNSRDNLARYSDGGAWCFGCGYREGGRFVRTQRQPESDLPKPPPDDTDYYFSNRAVEWFGKYGVTVDELIRHRIGWSPSREQVIYRFYDDRERLVLWQARNFRDGTTHKTRFITRGSPADNVVRYGNDAAETVVVVEDCVSALKVARNDTLAGLPCFRATLNNNQITKLSKRFKRMVVWLDSDKFREAKVIARTGKLVGLSTSVVFTERDPKEYSLEQINEQVQSG